jgi:hypothetical protein
VYYLPVIYGYTVIQTNDTLICLFNSQYSTELLSYMDLANHVILPSILILIFSTLLGTEVIKSRSRILVNFLKEENEYFFENIRLAISSIILNIIYLLLETPLSIYVFLPNFTQSNGYILSYYLFYLSYAINFYILFFSNSLFRKECVLFLRGSIKRLFNIK